MWNFHKASYTTANKYDQKYLEYTVISCVFEYHFNFYDRWKKMTKLREFTQGHLVVFANYLCEVRFLWSKQSSGSLPRAFAPANQINFGNVRYVLKAMQGMVLVLVNWANIRFGCGGIHFGVAIPSYSSPPHFQLFTKWVKAKLLRLSGQAEFTTPGLWLPVSEKPVVKYRMSQMRFTSPAVIMQTWLHSGLWPSVSFVGFYATEGHSPFTLL